MRTTTAILAVIMLAAPAAANPYYTLETTFTATPGTIQVGDRATFTLTMTLVADPVADAAAGVTVFGSAFGGSVNIDEGVGLTKGFFISGPGLPDLPYVVNFKSDPYLNPGDFIATITGQVEISIGCSPISTVCPQFANPYDTYAFFQATAPISVAPVPGPILGAGLPGLAAFCAGLLAWRRVKRPSGSI